MKYYKAIVTLALSLLSISACSNNQKKEEPKHIVEPDFSYCAYNGYLSSNNRYDKWFGLSDQQKIRFGVTSWSEATYSFYIIAFTQINLYELTIDIYDNYKFENKKDTHTSDYNYSYSISNGFVSMNIISFQRTILEDETIYFSIYDNNNIDLKTVDCYLEITTDDFPLEPYFLNTKEGV